MGSTIPVIFSSYDASLSRHRVMRYRAVRFSSASLQDSSEDSLSGIMNGFFVTLLPGKRLKLRSLSDS